MTTDTLSQARKHLYAWYTYAFAAEVFSACAMAIFLPITLEQMAREIGYASPDLTVSCRDVPENVEGEGVVCKARILGVWVDTASFSMYVKSLAVAIQAVSIISLGPLADSAYWRKKLLIVFAYTGSVSGILLLFFPKETSASTPSITALLTIIGNVGYAVSIVCANAFLPLLAREDPLVVSLRPHASQDQGTMDERGVESRALLSSTTDPMDLNPSGRVYQDWESPDSVSDGDSCYNAVLSLTTSRISSTGTGIGFFSGVTALGLLIIPISLGNGSTQSLRIAIGLSGIWWATFTIPVYFGLPGGSSPIEEDKSGQSSFGRFEGWKRVGRMFKVEEMKKLPNLFILLFAWMFLSDGFHTTTYTAILYASVQLQMPPSRIILIGILVQLSAVFSSLLTPHYQRYKDLSNLQILIRIVALASFLPFYACLGLVVPFGGLRTRGEMYFAATWFGLLYGPFNSYSRAVYAELIPPGHESSYFSLFALTDKSASFLGPFVVGIIADTTGNIRLGFLFLLVMLLAPIPVLLKLDVEEGRRQARSWMNS